MPSFFKRGKTLSKSFSCNKVKDFIFSLLKDHLESGFLERVPIPEQGASNKILLYFYNAFVKTFDFKDIDFLSLILKKTF